MKERHELFVNIEVGFLFENDVFKPKFTFMNKLIFITHFLENLLYQVRFSFEISSTYY